MAWTTDAPGGQRHTGYVLGRLADGTIPTYRSGQALYEREFTDSPNGAGGTWSGPGAADVDQPTALVPACRCGWRGPDTPYGGEALLPDDAMLEARAVWRAHAAAVLDAQVPDGYRDKISALARNLHELADERPRSALVLARQLREIADHLEPLAVAQALAQGVPWETIGVDLDQTKQAVHRRYGHPSASLEQRVRELTGGSVAALLAVARDRRRGTPPPAPRARWSQAVTRALRPPAGNGVGVPGS
ncbi:hypothetical protein ABZ851_37130 [Streptomyces sp. NPDC047049]|uniref:hypothetical protein n=1 Tax=Streptomyces sp. NPDC047049 TaxID=3156688 RepID=UPI0033CE645E